MKKKRLYPSLLSLSRMGSGIRVFAYLLAVFFCFTQTNLSSQNEISKWYFGNVAGLDLMNSPPTLMFNGNMSAFEGCSSLSDASGNLLMYTNGVSLLNRLHLQMPGGGNNLGGSQSSTQSSVIVKQPGNANIYYVFTTQAYEDNTHRLCYSVVDMNLAAGNGSVTMRGVTIYTNTSEKLAAVRQCNGTDYWIISQDRFTNTFRANPFTASGVGTAVLSQTGPIDMGCGSIKVSPGGGRLGMANFAEPGFSGPATPFSFALFDLNTATGIVSNPLDLGIYTEAYSCEFSADETKFYGSSDENIIHQWDLCAGNAMASHYVVYTNTLNPNQYNMGMMQLAANGKIYVSRYGKKGLGVINTPNQAGSSCNYADTSQTIAPKTCSYGLPEFAPYFKPVLPSSFTSTTNHAISCNTATFTASAALSCPYSSYIHSVLWDFGDPTSGAANGSTLVTATHAFQNPGTYSIQLVLFNRCGIALDTLHQQLSVQHFSLSGSSAFTVCAGNSLTLSAPGYNNYTWSNGSTASSIQVSPLTNTSYTVHAFDVYGCNHTAVQNVTVSAVPAISISGNTFVCRGSAVSQTVSGGIVYTWNNGATSSVITVAPSSNAVYSVSGTDVKGCKGTGTTSIAVINIPTLVVSSVTACNGAAAVISASSQMSLNYSWEPGTASGSSITVTAAGTQVYTVTASVSSCSNSATGTLTVISPDLSISPSVTIAPGGSATLQASGGESFSWQPADYLSCTNCPNPVATPPADMKYCVTASQSLCIASDCINIAVVCTTGDLSLPNAFTPNGDRNNDEFCLRGWECTKDFDIRIFDRWGENVFESTDPGFCWDGNFQGRLLDAAVFVYVIHAKRNNGDAFIKKGNITLIR